MENIEQFSLLERVSPILWIISSSVLRFMCKYSLVIDHNIFIEFYNNNGQLEANYNLINI